MDVESFAQQSALELVVKQLPGGGKDMNVAIVDIGANVMNVSVMRNDQSVYTREQAFGGNQLTQDIVARYGMSPEEAENAKRSGGLPDDFETEVLRPFMENLSHGGAARAAVLLHFDSVSQRGPDPARGRLGRHSGPGRGRADAHAGPDHGGQPFRRHADRRRASS